MARPWLCLCANVVVAWLARGVAATLTADVQGDVWSLVDVPLVVCTGVYENPTGTSTTETASTVTSTTETASTVAPVAAVTNPTAPGAVKIHLWDTSIANKDTPHSLTFYRTTDRAINLTFDLEDALGIEISAQSVSLPALDEALLQEIDEAPWETGRRLQAKFSTVRISLPSGPLASTLTPSAETQSDRSASPASERLDSGTCETFFLSDGRSPVDLPETWGQAREQFREMCVNEGYSKFGCEEAEMKVFAGRPSSHQEQMDIGDLLCSRLMNHAAAIANAEVGSDGLPSNRDDVPIPQHFKGKFVNFAKARRTKGSSGGGSYVMSQKRLASSYPQGYATMGYGYVGRGAMGMGAPIALGIGAGAVIGVGAIALSHQYPYSRYNDFCSSGVDCNCAEEECPSDYTLPAATNRDDILLGLIPQDYTFPLTLTITKIISTDFDALKICPPTMAVGTTSTTSTTSTSSTSSTTSTTSTTSPQQIHDLFVSLSEIDEESETNYMLWIYLIGFGTVIGVCGYCMLWKSNRRSKTQRGGGYDELDDSNAAFGLKPLDFESAHEGMEVRTQHTIAEGGDDLWYNGVVVQIDGSNVKVQYDDGDQWEGPMDTVYPLR